MKASRYNYFAKKDNQVICLNGITGRMLCLKPEEETFLQHLLECESFRKSHFRIVSKLVEGRFLIETEDEDLNLLRKKNRETINSQGCSLTINPTQNCNFKCWYCYENHIEGRMSEETMRRIRLFVDKQFAYNDLKYFSLGWFGGEPLMFFDEIVYPLSAYIKEKAEKAGIPFFHCITTNGFLLDTEVALKCKTIGLNTFQITLDGDRTTHDKVRNCKGLPSFDKILANCITMMQQIEDAFLTLRINYTTRSITGKNFAEILSCIPKELRSRIRVQFQRVWQTYEKEGSDNAVKECITNNQKYLEDAGFLNSSNTQFSLYKGDVCYADRKNFINVNYDGNVYRCTAQDYKPEDALGVINESGEVIWKEESICSVDEQANFDNPLCLECKYLPVCGGPCFSKRLYMQQTGHYFCPVRKMDTDIESFIWDSYHRIMKKRKEECKLTVG